MPKRLLILFPSIERGGAEEYSLTLARTALAMKWEVHAAFSARPKLQELAREFQASGARYHPIEVSDVETVKSELYEQSVAHIWPVAKLLLEVRPHAVILVLCGIDYALGSQISLALNRVPTAVVFQLVPPNRLLRENVRRVRSALMRTQAYITVSNRNRESLAESLGAATTAGITVIPNGVDLDKYRDRGTRGPARRAFIQELGLPLDAKIIVTVGRLDHQKGYDVLIAAAKQVVLRVPSARFIWAGDGPDRQMLQEMIAKEGLAGHISVLGYRRDVPSLLAAADLFVLPTRFEGQPFSVLEAMASGAPVVVSRVSGIEEIVTDGVHGLLCPPDDPASLQAAMLEALEDPRRMAECARLARDWATHFSASRMCADLLSLVDKRAVASAKLSDDCAENADFEEILTEITKALRNEKRLKLLAHDAANCFETGPLSMLGVAALIADYLQADRIAPAISDLHACAILKLQRSPADEGAWALLAVLAFRHGHPAAIKILNDWRQFERHGLTLIELAWRSGSGDGRKHLERLSYSHPQRPLRHRARYALLRDVSGVHRAREWLRLHILRFRNVRGIRKILARP